MNVLVFSWRDPKHPLAGGAEQVMHEHMKGWVRAGHSVSLFSSQFSGCRKEEIIDGIRIIRCGYQYLGVQLAGFIYYLKNKKNFDFLVDQFHGLPFFTPLYSRLPKLAVIQEVARKVWFLNPLPWPFNWVVGLVGYLGEPFIFRLYRKVYFMTGSDSAKRDLIRYGIKKSKIMVVPHGVKIFRPSKSLEKEKTPTIIFLGIHSKDKGIEDALECFRQLKRLGKFQFWTVGKFETDRYKKRILYMIRKMGLKSNIRMWGFVSQEKKFELLLRAHILINPSVHEGWGLVNIEANAMGTPVVAYKSAGLVDSVKHGKSGFLCDLNTPCEMANLVVKLLKNKRRLAAISRSCIVWSEKFDWEKSKLVSLNLIEGLLTIS